MFLSDFPVNSVLYGFGRDMEKNPKTVQNHETTALSDKPTLKQKMNKYEKLALLAGGGAVGSISKTFQISRFYRRKITFIAICYLHTYIHTYTRKSFPIGELFFEIYQCF